MLMIDTIKLSLKLKDGMILNRRRFRCVFSSDQFTKWAYEQNQEEKSGGIYFPKVEIIKLGSKWNVSLELSIPKLLHGENLIGIHNNEWQKVPEILIERLRLMRIVLKKDELLNAHVTILHLAMDFLLP